MSTVTNQPIQMSYFVADIATAVVTYDRLRWHRSRTGADGVFEAATAPAPVAAVLVGTGSSPHALNGKTFSFKVDGTTVVDVTFAAVDPVTTAQAVIEINGATAAVIASDADGYLQLTTASTGSAASIEILSSTAASSLGFVVGDGAVGQDTDTTLVAGTHEYFYTDNNSDDSFWYRVEFYNSTTGDTTGTGVAFPANSATHIPKSRTMVAYVRLADMSGMPIEGRRITVANVFLPNLVTSQNLRWGIFRHYVEMVTDGNGYAELRLLRGMQVDVTIEGTNFVRRLTIPSSGDSVDLLDPALAAEDEFGIQDPNIDFAIRLS